MNSAFCGEAIRLRLPHIELSGCLFGPEDGQPVIALHGWMDNLMSFARLAPRLEGLRILALDMAGHGYSAARPVGASYSLFEYAVDVLHAADFMGWQKFSLLGHSLGAIICSMLGASLPQRIEKLALIDGLIALTIPAEHAPGAMTAALTALASPKIRQSRAHPDRQSAIEARMRGIVGVNQEAAELLAVRGVAESAEGFRWNNDPRLKLPSHIYLTPEQANAFARALSMPTCLIVAEQGLLKVRRGVPELLQQLPVTTHHLPGRHHLHLESEAGAQAVAERFNRFFAT